jgi:ABC-type nitrate/sulfonate/bicarbonate transport system substrate-binding protein
MLQWEAGMSRKTAPLSQTAAFLLIAGLAGAPLIPATAAEGARASIAATELSPIPNPSTAYNQMAEAMGLFAKHGLALKPGPKLAGGGPERVQAVATNNTDLAISDMIAVMGGIFAGAKIKILMVMTPYGDEEIWARTEYKTMKDALGKSWAVASLGGAQRFNGQMAIEGMGLDPNGFRWLAIGGGDAPALEAVATGRTQLASLSHLGALMAEAKGYTKDIHDIVPHTAKYTPPMPRLVAVARADWIKDHAAAANAYVAMMLDMMRQWQDDGDTWTKPGETIFKGSGLTAKDIRPAWQAFRDGGYFSVNGGVNYAATQKVMDLFFQLRKESPNEYLSKPADLYDTGPLAAALDKMGLAKGTPGLPDTPDWYKGTAGHAAAR